MEAIVSDSHFQSQLSSIMEMLAKTAVAEIGKLVEQSHAVLRLEISRQVCENETLKNKCELLESELKAARRRAQHAATEAQLSGGLRDAGHRPTIDGVFGKEWCMDLWKEKESVEGRKGDTHTDSCLPEHLSDARVHLSDPSYPTSSAPPVDLMDDEPDMIIIKDESFEDGSGRNKLPESSGSGGKACATMEAVRGLVSRTLPLLPGEILDKVTERLEEVGVSQKEDLHLVTTEDLKGVLKPLHCRKLIKVFSAELMADPEPSNDSDVIEFQIVQPDVWSSPLPWQPTTSGFFQIPLHKLPNELVRSLAEQKRPAPALRREMVRVIVDDLFASEGRPSRLRLRQVAQQIVEQYPKSFTDISGDIIVGNGYQSLMLQLQNRVDNCLRHCTVALNKQPGQSSKKRPRFSDKYGCVEWQPPLPGNAEELENKRIKLCKSHKENLLPESQVRQLMKDTYCSQRLDINNQKNSISSLMEKWPYLFEAPGLFGHCETLLGFSVEMKLAEELSKQGQVVRDFINSRSENISQVENNIGALDMIKCLTGYFKEDANVLLINDQKQLPNTPCIIILDESSFKIAVEQTVTTKLHCPTVAVSYMFSMFYLLNIKYPKEAALTLEFLQRGFLGINPHRGTKAELKGKKQYCLHPKLLKFLSDLGDFQNSGEV